MFTNRKEAGQRLAEALGAYAGKSDTVVLALPRGGVAVGFEAARALHLPFDIVVARKIGAPGNPEYAIGAITETGDAILNEDEARHIDKEWLAQAMAEEKKEARRRLQTYRGGRPALVLRNKTIIIIDDGIATGYTMRAAVASVKARRAAKIVVAVPHGAADSIERIRREVEEVVALDTPEMYFAVGAHYRDFPQVEDKEVIALLSEAAH